MRLVTLFLMCVWSTALIGCGTAPFPPGGATTTDSDASTTDDGFSSSSPAKVRIESYEGVFVLSDAAVAKNAANTTPGLLAWWKDAATGEISIWSRLVHTQEDVGHALLSLERDFAVDLEPLITQDDALNMAVLEAVRSEEDPTIWQPSSYALMLGVMGFDSTDSAEDAVLNAELFTIHVARDQCPGVALKGNFSATPTPDPRSGPMKTVTTAMLIFNGCGEGGGIPDGPPAPCPGDIDCDGIPDSEDSDIDGDGIDNINDPDVDGDGIPNGEDSDVDGDGIDNGNDPDIDGDGLGNGSDSDVDGDGSGNSSDDDIDGDGNPNDTDDDDDGDGSPDTEDPSPGGCITDCSGACCNTTAGTCTLKSAAACSGANEQFQGTNVVCNLNPCCPFGSNPTFPPSSATISQTFDGIPPLPPDASGVTGTVNLNVTIDATCDGTQWCAVMKTLKGVYLQLYHLIPGVSEVTGPPPGNTAQANHCNQVHGLKSSDQSGSGGWYMLQATIDHENVHKAHLLPTLQNKTADIEALIESVCIPHSPGMTKTDAINVILGSDDYKITLPIALKKWSDEYGTFGPLDHAMGGPADQAERAVLDPMIVTICAFNKSQCWPVCILCPFRPKGACCAPDTGVCNRKTECDCEAGGGIYNGDNTTCDPTNPCKGACCAADFSCSETTLSRCLDIAGRTYQGDGTTCATVSCGPLVP